MLQEAEILYITSQTDEIKSVRFSQYPDGMPIVDHMRGFCSVARILLRPNSLQSFVTAMFWVDAMTEYGHKVPELVLPCVPGARQDRLNPQGDYLFTAKSIAKMINQRNFPRVTIVDPHSEVISGLIDRCSVRHSSEYILDFLGGDGEFQAIVSPDAGAEKRAGYVAKSLQLPLIHAWKTRNVKDGKISGFGIEPDILKYLKVLIVDDICDGGGTFLGLRKTMPAEQHVSLFVTHGFFSQGTQALLNEFDYIYTTDSLVNQSRTNIIEIPICEKLLTERA